MADQERESWRLAHLLAEPTRRRVYDAVRVSRSPVTRDQVAEQIGISRTLAAFHLDQLAEAQLLDVSFARPAGRGGPGAGRPAKRYAASTCELMLSLPQRRYDLVARILACGVRDSGRKTSARAATQAAAHAEGRQIGELRRPAVRGLSRSQTLECVTEVLDDLGFEPGPESPSESDQPPLPGGAVVRMRNCPFHAIVDVAPEIVCGLNKAFIEGLLEGLGGHEDVAAVPQPAPPDCCVKLAFGTE
jgi:predicted ArsR family transcriptional regulator